MNNLELALSHASKGYYVFPAQPENKRPKPGFMDWEGNSSRDPELIKKWWSDGDWLPAVAPGRTGHAVIDVDRHPGQPDGFKTLESENIVMRTMVTGTSLSGNGTHFWHLHTISSLNGILVSVDRKAQGGYVVVPYELPNISEIVEPLPEKLAGNKKTSNVERKYKSVAELNAWLRTVGAGEPDDEMWRILEMYQPAGNQHMSVQIARVVSLAAKGHPGGTYVLDEMQERWMGVPHSSGDPEEEFQVNVRSAIEKFGEPVPDTSLDDKIQELLSAKKEVSVNLVDLQESLLIFCKANAPDWESIKEDPDISAALRKCLLAISYVRTLRDIDRWRESTKRLMAQALLDHWRKNI